MSYCMFENTANDLEECLERMQSVDFCIATLEDEASSVNEEEGINRLIDLCREIAEKIN